MKTQEQGHSSEGGVARCVAAPQARSARWSKIDVKINILKDKFDFLDSKIFKLLNRIKGNTINNWDIFKFIIPLTGGHSDYWPLGPEKSSYVTAWRSPADSTDLHRHSPPWQKQRAAGGQDGHRLRQCESTILRSELCCSLSHSFPQLIGRQS